MMTFQQASRNFSKRIEGSCYMWCKLTAHGTKPFSNLNFPKNNVSRHENNSNAVKSVTEDAQWVFQWARVVGCSARKKHNLPHWLSCNTFFEWTRFVSCSETLFFGKFRFEKGFVPCAVNLRRVWRLLRPAYWECGRQNEMSTLSTYPGTFSSECSLKALVI